MEGHGNQRAREEVPATTSDENENFEFASSDEQEAQRGGGASSNSNKVRYIRHTPEQTEELESFFKKNAHPSEKERKEISHKLNIDMKKVKFWFQNRRTQMKTQTGRHENAILKQENEQLRLENLALKEALKNPLCNKCGGQATAPDRSIQDHKLLIENARLKEELGRMSSLTNQLLGKPVMSYTGLNPVETGVDMPNIQRNGYLEQASSAMEELLKLGLVNAPLWIKSNEGGGETLNLVEYERAFPPCLAIKPLGFVSEASRASGVVPMTSSTLVEALLDADRWREMFGVMIGSGTTMEVISNGIGGSRNGALQLMKAEIQLVSPLVPVRALKFIRFAKQQAEGLWIVVDLSIGDYGMEGQLARRCPSGCILNDMPNGFSMVTWIEHTEYDEQLVSHQYRQLVRSGLGFGAQRWVGALLRHCEGLRATTSPTLNQHLFQDTRRSLKGLAQRMTSIFCSGVCLTGGQWWDLVAAAPGRPRIMARQCTSGLGEPLGVVTSAACSVWIPTNHQHLFDMLLTKELRFMWDVVCHRIAATNMIQLPLGQDETGPNCISILNSDAPTEGNQIMVLQEIMSDMTGSLIVYATLDFPTVSVVMNGGDISSVALLPSGLHIVPGYGEDGASAPSGSMVTVGFQILHPDLTTSNLITIKTINMINGLVGRTVDGIQEIVRLSGP